MNTIFMNSENSKTSRPHVLILHLIDKIDLRRGKKRIALSSLTIYYTWKNIKNRITIISSKYLLQDRMMNLNCQMDQILYPIIKIILSIF